MFHVCFHYTFTSKWNESLLFPNEFCVIVSFILIQSVVLKYGEQLQSLNANASTFAKKSYENHNSVKACVDQLFQSTKIMEIQKVPVYTFVHLP